MMLRAATHLQLQAKLFRGLGDPSRLSLIQALVSGPKTVGELVAATGLSQPNASNHLGCLRDCGLVRSEQDGRHVRYELAVPAVRRVLDAGQAVLARVADRVCDCVNYGSHRHG